MSFASLTRFLDFAQISRHGRASLVCVLTRVILYLNDIIPQRFNVLEWRGMTAEIVPVLEHGMCLIMKIVFGAKALGA
eukprot:343944-Pelagomonas_calceolata.AAC.1